MPNGITFYYSDLHTIAKALEELSQHRKLTSNEEHIRSVSAIYIEGGKKS